MHIILLFCRKLRKNVKEYTFMVNPDILYVANKWIMGKIHPDGGHLMTMIWHVTDLCMSCKCKDSLEHKQFQFYPGKIYGSDLTINHGWKYNYLGLNSEFYKDGALKMEMFKYLNNIIMEIPEDVGRKTPTSLRWQLISSSYKATKIGNCYQKNKLSSSTIL